MTSRAHRSKLIAWQRGEAKTKKTKNGLVYSDHVKSKKGLVYWRDYIAFRWSKTYPKKRRGLWDLE